MATQLAPIARRPDPRRSIRVLEDESTVDVRAWARQFVGVLLDLEGVSITPGSAAEPSVIRDANG